MKVLVVNSGSATQKISLTEVIDQSGSIRTSNLWDMVSSIDSSTSRKAVIAKQLDLLKEKTDLTLKDIDAVGHRVVHGGSSFIETTRVSDQVISKLEAVSDLAPIHNPPALESLEFVREKINTPPHILVFDTSFHSTIEPELNTYAIPNNLSEKHGIKRYGFHGISHKNAYEKSKQLVEQNVENSAHSKMVSCHLGGGSSLCAIQNGTSIDTTMGFTPCDGLIMSTRAGAIDPGIITFLLNKENLSANQIESILNKESGIRGVSDLSGDMKELIDCSANGNPKASLALSMYIISVQKFIATMCITLKGIDVLSFTGGIGENSKYVREEVAKGLTVFGIEIDPELNKAKANNIISPIDTHPLVTVVDCDESGQIAKECFTNLNQN